MLFNYKLVAFIEKFKILIYYFFHISYRYVHFYFNLHWLPVAQRIQYKILSLCYKALNNFASSYLSNSLQIYTPSRTLRSASDPLVLRIPRTKLSTFGSRSFSAYGPSLWNTLPLSIRQKPSLSSFKSALKTHLFQQF